MKTESKAECGECPWTGYEDETHSVTDIETGDFEVTCPECASSSVIVRA